MALFDDLLRCPVCKGDLEIQDKALCCRSCKEHYRREDGIWDLIPAGSASIKLSERDHYSEKSDYYLHMHATWRDSPFYLHYHGSFLEDLRQLPADSLVLEVGCGLGTDGLELLRSGRRLVETDIAPGQLREARRLHRNSGYGASSDHLLADAEFLPFADDSFDGAFMVACLHHLPDPLRSLREIVRVLKPGGIFALGTEPNNWQHHTIYPPGKILLKMVTRLLGKGAGSEDMVSEADKLTEGFSRRQLNGLFAEAGFRQWSLKPAGYLSAAIFFLSTELSQLIERDIRLFPLEKLFIPIDEALGRTPLLKRYPWHWNATAR
jgi:ubiquinone/menaquinone biosynthesis C-methylase UbiE/uncharacterized protein YbaR (Trm112 family)